MIKFETIGAITLSKNNPVIVSETEVANYTFLTYEGSPYLIMNEIDKEFNEKKLAGIGNLSFNSAERLVVSAYLAGYSLKYGHSEFN